MARTGCFSQVVNAKMPNLGVVKVEEDFKWGIMKGRSRNDKDANFYNSFTYNGVEYHLYDCAMFYQEGDLETSVGKLVQLYEMPNRERKVKVVWFLRPIEIRNFLRDSKPGWNEIFLASGEGSGLCNDNCVEAIIGKCNVVCTLKDERNPPASEAELSAADYIFYRSFDVGKLKISDKFADKIEGIKVEHFFNRNNHHKLIAFTNVEANVEKWTKSSSSPSKSGLDNVVHQKVKDGRSDCFVKSASSPSKLGLDRAVHNGVKNGKSDCFVKSSSSPSKLGLDKVVHNGVRDGKSDCFVKSSSSASKLGLSKVVHNGVRDGKSGCSVRSEFKDLKKAAGSAGEQPDTQPYKKRKLLQPAEGSTTQNMAPPEVNDFDGMWRTSNVEVPQHPCTNDCKTVSEFLEVTRRPDIDRRNWFKQRPWEEKLETARELCTLVFLENLDPSFTSLEVEDIIWSALGERVEAKMIQHGTFSSPHYGKAFVIFKSKEVADKALHDLRNRCLMLPDGRPVVARRRTQTQPGRSDTFVGHLTMDKSKFKKQREEMRNAVSTSHSAQPNTIEYGMAVEWRLLNEKSELWWKALHKRQEEEMINLWNQLKEKSSGKEVLKSYHTTYKS